MLDVSLFDIGFIITANQQLDIVPWDASHELVYLLINQPS